MDLDVADDAALVTASTAGIGLASATALAAEGANVAVCGPNRERLADASERVAETAAGEVVAVEADRTDPDDVARLVDEVVDALGGLDHLVTVGAGSARAAFFDADERDWYRAYDRLLMSLVWTVEEAHRHLIRADGGTITAVTAQRRSPDAVGGVLPATVDRAVVALARRLSRAFAPEVRVNAVLPGAIETPDRERGEAAFDALAADVPMGRPGDPGDVGDVVAFLASPRASFVTGAAVPVDGGSSRA